MHPSPEQHSESSRTILIVEDSTAMQASLGDRLETNGFSLLQAEDLEEAERLFDAYASQICAVLLDGCVPGKVLNTVPLLHRMRERFSGPIIAMSSCDVIRQELVREGCSHECEKYEAASVVLHVLRGEQA